MKCPKYDTTIETNQTKIYKQNKTKQTNRCFAWKNKHTLRSFLYLVSFRKSFCLHKKNSEKYESMYTFGIGTSAAAASASFAIIT